MRYVLPWVLLAACAEDSLTRVGTVTDEFVQLAAAEVDVLWVVDNSESMQEEQASLGSSYQAFVDLLVQSDVDYHIGVISTDPADRGVLSAAGGAAFIARGTDQAQARFMSNVQLGTGGARLEKSFETTAMALGVGGAWEPGHPANPANPGFLRDDALLFIIMVSDEDDKSFGPVHYYERLFKSYKGPGNEGLIKISAIVGAPRGGACGANMATHEGGCSDPHRGFAGAGDRYVELAGATGGIYTCICEDFSDSLEALSLTASGLEAQFGPLANTPNPDSVIRDCESDGQHGFCVRVNGTVIAHGQWTYVATGNTLRFDKGAVPPPQAKITVEYMRGAR
jgi:hypothetical protein